MANFLRKLRRGVKQNHPRCAAIVPAAGSARRMEGTDKMLATLDGVPVLIRSLLALEGCPLIDEIIVVTREDLIVQVGQLCRDYSLNKVTKVLKGGSSRTESVWLGLREVSPQTVLCAVHDGARPLVPSEVVEEVIHTAAKTRAAVPAVPVKDTVKRAANGRVTETLPRAELFAIQTPQVFDTDLLRGALQRVMEENAEVTDDCAAVERLDMTVTLTRGSDQNIKITTPVDLAIGEAILRWQGQI